MNADIGGKRMNLRQEVLILRHELKSLRLSQELHAAHYQQCGGGDNCEHFHKDVEQQAKQVKEHRLYIAYLENEINKMRFKYEKQMRTVKTAATGLDEELISLRKELRAISGKAKRVDRLEKKIKIMEQKLDRRNTIIGHYDRQHTDVLDIVRKLQEQSGDSMPDMTINLRYDETLPSEMLQASDQLSDEEKDLSTVDTETEFSSEMDGPQTREAPIQAEATAFPSLSQALATQSNTQARKTKQQNC